MTVLFARRAAALFLSALITATAAAEDLGIRAPEGFEVSLYAGDDLAHDIFSMTIDSRGRVVVAGKDYVKILHDDNGDGDADRASLFSERPKSGAHGMVFVGDDLLCTGDNSLMLLRDKDGDGAADGEPETWAELKHPEHGANGIVHGPDGWFYVICGNDAGVSEKHATTSGSPVKHPQSGAVVRFSPDGKQSEIFAHGFRNPYDLDFSVSGHLFTVDADGERDHHLPWYAPTRLFDIQQGMHHGWVLQGWQRSWNRPPYFFDSVSRAAEIGRGSPTGLLCYRHTQFPKKYRGSILSACWTMGRVYHLPLKAAGSTFVSTPEVFLETTGETGFAPVDLAVGPDGDLFIAIGGRRTRGSVFRVSYRGDDAEINDAAEPQDDLSRVLNAPQPLAAWSRAQWMPLARALGRQTFIAAARDPMNDAAGRTRAIEIIIELFGGIRMDEPLSLAESDDQPISAKVAWSMGRSCDGPLSIIALLNATEQKSATVNRAAWEALASLSDAELNVFTSDEMFEGALANPDRRIKTAALCFGARLDSSAPDSGSSNLWRLAFRGELTAEHADAAVRAFENAKDDSSCLSAVRLIELALGDIDAKQMEADVYAGYALKGDADDIARIRDTSGETLADAFPSGDENLNKELARLLAMLGVENESLIERMTQVWSEESSPAADLHYLICLSRLPGPRSEAATGRTAAALCGIHRKMAAGQMHVSRNWPLRVGETLVELYRRDDKLAASIINRDDFGHPAQALLARHMPDPDRPIAIRKLLHATAAAMASGDDIRWTEELISLAGELPASDAFPLLRQAFDDYAVRDAVVAVLAAEPQAADRERFVEALSSVQPTTIEQASQALAKVAAEPTPAELRAAFAALRQACTAPEATATRKEISALLSAWTQQPIEVEDTGKNPAADFEPWFDWFDKTYPDEARTLAGLSGATADQWQSRLSKIDWDSGEARRGLVVFEKKACHRCHAGNSPLGPSLAGAAGRFSREDLFTAILDPHKEVSPLYQTTQVATKSGRVVSGLVVYESPDSTLLQTSPDVTTRIIGDEILSMKKSKLSLMPSGLLNDVSDQELADLYAHLKSLRGKEPNPR